MLGFWEIPNEDDQPPPEMYGNDEQLAEWFKGVKWRRDNPGSEELKPIHDPDMERNELSAQWFD